MARFDEIYQALMLGGHSQTVIEANVNEQNLPDNTLLILPSNSSCIISSIKTNDSTEIATGIAGHDLAEFPTIIAAPGLLRGQIKHLAKITMPTGRCIAISE